MAAPQQLDDHGNPIGAGVQLDDQGNPIRATAPPSMMSELLGGAGDALRKLNPLRSDRQPSIDAQGEALRRELAATPKPSIDPKGAGLAIVKGFKAITPRQVGEGATDLAVSLGAGKLAGSASSRASGLPPTSHEPTPVRDFVRNAGAIAEGAQGGGALTKWAGRALQSVPEQQTFQELPLAEQMEHLFSTRPDPTPARGGDPIHQPQTPFHEQPLAQQMDRLPATPAPEGGRLATRPYTAPEPAAAPLYEQAEAVPPSTPATPYRATEPPPMAVSHEPAPAVEPAAPPAKPKLSAADVARALRDEHGAEKGGQMLWGKGRGTGGMTIAEKAQRLRDLAPGPSKVPAAAQARIDAYNARQAAEAADASESGAGHASSFLRDQLLASLDALGKKPR